MNNENLQDIMLEPDTLIDYGEGVKAVQDFFGCEGFFRNNNYSIDAYNVVNKFFNQSPVVILKDIDGKPIKALDLVEFEEHMKNESVKGKEKNNDNIVMDYDILYEQYFNGVSYRCYHGRYDSNDTSVVDSIKKYCNNNAFSKIRDDLAEAYDTPREELNLNLSFVDYIETHYQLLSLVKKYENIPDSPVAGYVRFDQMDLNYAWADRLSHNYERLENIENKVAELEKNGLREPQIIFLDKDRFCKNMPLKYAEYEEEYIKEDEKLNYLVLFKGENSTHRIYGEHLQLSPDKQARRIIDGDYDQYQNTPWIKEIFEHADYQYNCEDKDDYKALLKYIVDNCPSIGEKNPSISLFFDSFDEYREYYNEKNILLNELKPEDLLINNANDVIKFSVDYTTPLGIINYTGKLTGYINKNDVDLRKAFLEIKSADKYGQGYKTKYKEKLLVRYIDEKILPNLPKESIIKRAKRKARLILDFTKNNSNDNDRYRER